MDVKRQYEKDKDAEKYLTWVHKIHNMQRDIIMRNNPLNNPKTKDQRREYEKAFRECLPLKIEIINTEAAQLSLTPILIQTQK